jgi:hypothetical protein
MTFLTILVVTVAPEFTKVTEAVTAEVVVLANKHPVILACTLAVVGLYTVVIVVTFAA